MKKVFIIGSLNYDLVIRTDRMPGQGETISGYGFMDNCGGKGANQAVAAARAGCKTYMTGCVGQDVFGENQLKNLKKDGINTDYIRAAEGPTGIAVIVVADGDNSIILDAGANAKVSASDVDNTLKAAEAGDFLVIQYEIPESINSCAIKAAKAKGMTVIVNPAPARVTDASLFPLIDYFIPNETELELISGIKGDADKGAEKLLKAGIKNIIVTLGSKGAAAYSKAGKVTVPAYKVKAVDTTAAGDTFIGYFTAGLAAGKAAADAMKQACAAASLTVQKKGAQISIPFKADVDKVLS